MKLPAIARHWYFLNVYHVGVVLVLVEVLGWGSVEPPHPPNILTSCLSTTYAVFRGNALAKTVKIANDCQTSKYG